MGSRPPLRGGSFLTRLLLSPGDVNIIQPNYPAAAQDFLRAFRSGLLGPVMLDRDILQSLPQADPCLALRPRDV